MKKGFTLVELLAVIIILGIISLISTPIILNVIEDSKKNAGLSEANLIYKEIKKFCDTEEVHEGINNYKKICTNGENIKNNLDKMVSLGKINKETIEIYYENGNLSYFRLESNEYNYELVDEQMKLLYKDKSGANTPKLLKNMIPIKYNGNNWIYADVSEEWYNYDNQEWANAVVLNNSVRDIKQVGDIISEEDIDLWYVWIPRYKYQLFNVEGKNIKPVSISIEFEKGKKTTGIVKCKDNISINEGEKSEFCENAQNGNFYTHPAFTFGTNELLGLWVGKFELGANSNNIYIAPGKNTMIGFTLNEYINSISNFPQKYNINGDSHMIKNIEWGAVAYLSQAKKSIKINRITEKITGGGDKDTYKSKKASSTTQNIYGIYDMSGLSEEYVMGLLSNSTDKSGLNFNKIDKKYYDIYNLGYGKLGDSVFETFGWFGESNYYPDKSNPWFVRGGHASSTKAGIFSSWKSNGIKSWSFSTRSVLVEN